MAPLQLPAWEIEPQVSVSGRAERPVGSTHPLDPPVGRGELAAAELHVSIAPLRRWPVRLVPAPPITGRGRLNRSFLGPPIVLFKAALRLDEETTNKPHS